jgi:hypothetical protein
MVMGAASDVKSIYYTASLFSFKLDLFWNEILKVLPTNLFVLFVIGEPFIAIRFI